MIVKPPAHSTVQPVDRADLIDVFPTIARLLDVDVPVQCQGRAWQDGDREQCRITERIGIDDVYSIAVEENGEKHVYSYRVDEVRRPDADRIDEPDLVEVYQSGGTDDVPYREETDRTGTSSGRVEIIRAFMSDGIDATRKTVSGDVDSDIEDRLKYLGYK